MFLALFSQFAFSVHIFDDDLEFELGETKTYLNESTETYTTVTYIGNNKYLVKQNISIEEVSEKDEKAVREALFPIIKRYLEEKEESDSDEKNTSKEEVIRRASLIKRTLELIEEDEEAAADYFIYTGHKDSTEEADTSTSDDSIYTKIKEGKISVAEMHTHFPPTGNMK